MGTDWDEYLNNELRLRTYTVSCWVSAMANSPPCPHLTIHIARIQNPNRQNKVFPTQCGIGVSCLLGAVLLKGKKTIRISAVYVSTHLAGRLVKSRGAAIVSVP